MKKETYFASLIILLIFLVFCLLITNTATAINIITGETITGRAPSQQTNVSIYVLADVPVLTIISPESKTYLTNDSLLLNYTAHNADNIWYNLDDTNNITLASYVYFNITHGGHTLNLYANNSQGEANKSVTFIVNSSCFIMNYTKWSGDSRGETTDFNCQSYEDLQNLSNVVLEDTHYGKIFFNEAINLTDDYNPDDNEVDIDSYVNISSNRIEINTAYLNNLNKSAILYFYNLTLTNPRILINGQVCPSSICTKESYSASSGTLIFNVTHFTTYSAEETPTEEETPTPSGGGRGGGGITTIGKFKVDKEKIRIKLKQGETKKQEIIIENIGTQKLKLDLSIFNLENFVRVREEHFELNKSESKTIALDFIVSEDASPDLYMGKLIIKSDGIEKEILIAIEVESKKPLFDVKVNIPEKFLHVMPGEEILAEISLYSLGAKGRVDVVIDYTIKDEQGSIIISEQETKAVETETSFIKTLKIPEDTKFGNYIFYAKATYDGEVASASAWFSVGKLEIPFFKKENIFLIIIIIFIIVLLFVLIELRTLKKHIKAHMKIDENILVKENLIKVKNERRLKKW